MPSVTVLVMVPMASSFTIDVIFSVRACKAWSSKLSSLKRTVHEASALFMSGPLVCQHVRFCRFFSRPQTWRKASNIIGASFGSYIVSLSQVVRHHTALLGHQSWHSCHVLPDIVLTFCSNTQPLVIRCCISSFYSILVKSIDLLTWE
jgi:hypothetical protein